MKFRVNRKHIPYILFLFFGIVIFVMGILNHYFFRTVTHDYGNYNFAFWDYSHFRISQLTPFHGNFIQDHFSFTLMYFIPVYWLLNWLTQTYTLIIIQCSMIMIAGWYSYRIVRLKSDNWWLGIGVIVYYFMLLGRYTSFSSDVNLAIISSCFIPIFIYYFEIKKYLVSLIVLVLSLFSRENIPLWFIFIFIVLIIEHRKDKRAVLFSLIGIVISIVFFVLLFKVFIPSIQTPGTRYELFNYSALGANPGEALLFVLKHPIETIKLFFVNDCGDPARNGVKAEFYIVYLISGGFILFRRPQYFLWFLPIVAQKVLNDDPIRWGIAIYYSIEVVTLLPLSVFLVLASLKKKAIQNSLTIAVCVVTIAITVYKLNPKNNCVPWTVTPAKQKIYDKRFYKPPFNIKNVNKLLALIPDNAKVSASNKLLPHIAQRQFIYYFPIVKDAEFIVFSVFDDTYFYSTSDNEKERVRYLSDPNWEVVAKEYPVFLLRNKDVTTSEKNTSNLLWTISDTIRCNYEMIDSVNRKILLSDGGFAENLDKLVSDKSHSGASSMALVSKNTYSSSIKINNVGKIVNMQLTVWCDCGKDGGCIIASCGKDFYKASFEADSLDDSGWKRLVLSFWMPQNIDTTNFYVSFGSNSSEPVYFDDLEIVKNYLY